MNYYKKLFGPITLITIILLTIFSSLVTYKYFSIRNYKAAKIARNLDDKLSLEIIKKYEDFSSTFYLCPSGKKTIGYGDTEFFVKILDSDDKVSKEDSEMVMLMKIKSISLLIKYSLFPNNYQEFSSNEKAAVISLIYNIGEGKFKSSRLYNHINDYLFLKFEKNDKNLLEKKNIIKKEWSGFYHFKDKNTKKMVKSICKKEDLCLANRRKEEISLFFNIN